MNVSVKRKSKKKDPGYLTTRDFKKIVDFIEEDQLSRNTKMATNVTPVLCYHCSDVVTAVSADSIGCAACDRWAHRACASVKRLKEDEIKLVNWICTPCLDLLKIHLRDGEKILNKLDKLQK